MEPPGHVRHGADVCLVPCGRWMMFSLSSLVHRSLRVQDFQHGVVRVLETRAGELQVRGKHEATALQQCSTVLS